MRKELLKHKEAKEILRELSSGRRLRKHWNYEVNGRLHWENDPKNDPRLKGDAIALLYRNGFIENSRDDQFEVKIGVMGKHLIDRYPDLINDYR